jgi:hypothetical protein
MKTVNSGVLAVAAAAMLANAGAIWKSIGFKSYIIKEYQTRLSLAQSGLDEVLAETLRILVERVNEVLGLFTNKFDPERALADPSRLQTLVSDVTALYNARQNLPRYYRGLLRVGPIAFYILGGLLISTGLAFSYFTGLARDRIPGYVGLWASLALLAAGGAAVVYYRIVQSKFDKAELLSKKAAK